jgi:hypothetical protein
MNNCCEIQYAVKHKPTKKWCLFKNDDTEFFQTVGQVAQNGFNVTKERALSGEYYSEKAGERILKNLEKLEKQNKAMLSAWLIGANTNPQQTDLEKGSGFVSQENRNKKAHPKPNFSHVVSKNMQDPNGQYMWLFSGMK